MNIILWIIQILLAVAFFGHGYLMLFPPADMAEVIKASLPTWFRLFLGIAEWLGALGLLLPGSTRIMPHLTAWAAIGLAIIVGLATPLHLSRGEYSSAVTTFVLLVLSAFVAYMRWKQQARRHAELASA